MEPVDSMQNVTAFCLIFLIFSVMSFSWDGLVSIFGRLSRKNSRSVCNGDTSLLKVKVVVRLNFIVRWLYPLAT